MFDFAWPWLFILLPLPWLLRWLLPAAKQDTTALNVTFLEELAAISGQTTYASRTSWPTLFPWIFIWFSLVIAAARPQWVGDTLPSQPTGRDLLMAVDTSGSMQESDMTWQGRLVDRLSLIKKLFGPFIESRHGDRVGLILFGSNAYLQSPLTFDRKTVKTWLDEAMIGIAGTQTAIGDAIALGTKRLYGQAENSRVLIIITDGSNNAGNIQPSAATKLAVQAKVKIYTIGIGSDKMIRYGFTNYSASADLDEDSLRQIAKETGGQYFRARSEADLAKISAILNKLEPVKQPLEQTRYIQEYYSYPLAVALLLTMFLIIFKLYPPLRNWRPL